MAKSKPKKITVGARVQLKNDKQTDGVVMSVVGKAKWRVRWDEGKQQGTVAEQSSKSLRLWQFNLADFDAGDAEGSDSSEDEPVEPTNHPALKRKFEAYAAQLEGTKVVVDYKGGKVTWEHVPRGSSTVDYFPHVPGPIGVVAPTQMNVLKGYVFRGEKGDALRAWLQLYPGDINKHVAAISAAMKAKDEKAADLTLGEYVVWHGLFIAATVCVQRGHELWDVKQAPRRFRKHPNFAEFMPRNRFDAIKSCLLAACGDASLKVEDKWWGLRPLVDGFNDNRRLNVEMSDIQIPDEAMSGFQPRTTAAADLDHLSFVERKPKKLGTEAKCVADGRSGVMRFLEIQEGKDAMALKRHRASFAPATAQAMRLVEGVRGERFVF